MAANQALVNKLYRSVIEDVVNGVREAFLDEGVDEAVLLELKQIWENKLSASKVIEPLVDPAEANLQNKISQSQQSAAAAASASSSTSGNQTARQQPAASTTSTTTTSTTAATTAAPAVRMVPVQITVPPQPGSGAGKSITVQVPAHALQGGSAGAQLQAVLSSPTVTAALSLPVDIATTVLQQHINAALNSTTAPATTVRTQTRPENGVPQLDGPDDSSDDDEDDVDDDDDDVDEEDDRDDEENDDDNDDNHDEEPLNSEDDVTDEDPSVLFETDNVVVCQYDKITRSRNRWKFHLKDGIMNINGRDYVFQKANGDAEW